MSKMGEELERLLDENKYELFFCLESAYEELLVESEELFCEHEVGICCCAFYNKLERIGRVLQEVRKGRLNETTADSIN